MTRRIFQIALALAAAITLAQTWAGPDRPTEFTNQGGIVNTRHNMSLRNAAGSDLLAGLPNGGNADTMDFIRNNYGEVCVYCHTPHGANAGVAAPLWNRNIPNTTYTTYNQLNTTSLTQTVYQPGAGSLTCLSCHDGQQAIDAIINMPGSGRYSTTSSEAFLDSWPSGNGELQDHLAFGACVSCHQPGIPTAAADFRAAAIGTDLRDDHPVGVTFPLTSGSGTDWNTPATRVVNGQSVKFFDDTPNGRVDKSEIRLYDSGNGPSVECASCHDPHGVPSAGPGSKFNPTFLRKTNAASGVCLTCHNK